jgi:hypothetical protein
LNNALVFFQRIMDQVLKGAIFFEMLHRWHLSA